MRSTQALVCRLKVSQLNQQRRGGSETRADPLVATTAIAPATTAMEVDHTANQRTAEDDIPRSIYSSAVSGNVEDVIKTARRGNYEDESKRTGTRDAIDEHLERSVEAEHPHPKDMEKMVQPEPGKAVAAPAYSEETRATMNEMSEIKPGEDELTMNRE